MWVNCARGHEPSPYGVRRPRRRFSDVALESRDALNDQISAACGRKGVVVHAMDPANQRVESISKRFAAYDPDGTRRRSAERPAQ